MKTVTPITLKYFNNNFRFLFNVSPILGLFHWFPILVGISFNIHTMFSIFFAALIVKIRFWALWNLFIFSLYKRNDLFQTLLLHRKFLKNLLRFFKIINFLTLNTMWWESFFVVISNEFCLSVFVITFIIFGN